MSGNTNAGTISINLRAGTQQFSQDLDNAGKKLRELGGHGVTGTQAASAALRTLEGNVQHNIRAAEVFISKTLGMGSILQSAFPVVGAIALGGTLSALVSKAGEVFDAFKKLQDAPTRISQGLYEIEKPIKNANDQLVLSNAQLDAEIAKLQGKPQNNLAIALAEVVAQSDALADSLDANIKKLQEFLEKESVGSIGGFLTGQASTADQSDSAKEVKNKLEAVSRDEATRQLAANGVTERAAIATEADKKRKAILEAGRVEAQAVLDASQKANAAFKSRPVGSVDITGAYGMATGSQGVTGPQSNTARVNTAGKEVEFYSQALLSMKLADEHAAKTQTKRGLDTSANNAKLTAPFAQQLDEIKTKFTAITALTRAAGSGDSFLDAQAKAAALSATEIDKVNAKLKEMHQPLLTLGQQSEIISGNLRNSLAEMSNSLADKNQQQQKTFTEGAERLSEQLAAENTKHQEKLALLDQEIAAAKTLAAVQGKGSEAIFAAQESIRLAAIADPDEQAKQKELGEIKHAASIQGTIEKINQETAATSRLADAYNKGVEARRNAELENIKQSGQSPDVIAAQIAQRQGQFNQEDITSGSARGGGSAKDGFNQYFQEMADSAKSSATQIKEVMGSAFQGVNDQLANLVTGQKTSWGSLFTGLASQLAKLTLQSAESSLFKNLLGGATGAAGGASSGAGGLLGGLFGKILGGARADGGSVDPGKAFLVGERGPEIFTPPSAGSIIPNHKLGGGDTHNYSISVGSGVDPAQTERAVRSAIIASHNSAIKTSQQVNSENLKRTPQK